MRILDQELLTAQKKGVVTNGLTFWIDGSDNFLSESSSGKYNYAELNERVSGNSCHYTGYGVTGNTAKITKINNCYRFTEQYYHTSTHNIVPQEVITSVETIECSFGFSVERNTHALYMCERLRLDTSTTFGGAVMYLTNPSSLVHIVATIVNGKAALYKNGTLVGVGNNLSQFDIGTIYNSKLDTYYSPRLDVKIGFIRLYNRNITEKEILQNYKYEQSLGRIGI